MPGVTTTAQMSKVEAREVDFVTRFTDNWDALRQIMGISRPIRKQPGTKLVTYSAAMVDATLQGGASVGEGQTIPATQFTVVESGHEDIVIEKYKKAVSIEAVAKYGARVAVEKTDDAFLAELTKKTLKSFYTFLATGTLTGTQKTWQRALAIAKGAVINQFKKMNKTVTEVVGFANIMDYYDWLGDQQITVQTLNGIQYIKDFMGYSTLFLCGDNEIASKTVIALPVENIDLYYIDPSDSEFAELGLEYRVAGETNLVGFHVEGNYSNATGEAYAIEGTKLWAEFLDGICVVTVGSTNTPPSAPVVVPPQGDEEASS